MKVVFTVLFVAVCVSALPGQHVSQNEIRKERIVSNQIQNQIRRLIQEASAAIRDAGLDPLVIDRINISESPVPILVTINAFIDSLLFTGASDIVIQDLDYSVIWNRLRFNIALPELRLSIGDAGLVANVFGTRYTGVLRGYVATQRMTISGEVRVNIGIISGITIRSLSVTFRLVGIQSSLTLVVQDVDYSSEVNTLLGETFPGLLEAYRDDIDQWLTDVIRDIADKILGRSAIAQKLMAS